MAVSSRRDFVVAGSAVAVSAASLLASRRAFAGPAGFANGIQLYTVNQALAKDAAGTLQQLKAIGYTEVEAAGQAAQPGAGTGPVSMKDFRAMLDAAGLACPSAHLQLTAPDLSAQFEDAHVLGAHYAVSSVLRKFDPAFMKAAMASMKDPSVKAPPVPSLGIDGFRKMAAQMNDVGAKARAAGLQYAYHNHNFEFEKMPDGSPGYDVLLKETDAALVKFEIDCGWMTVAGYSPVEYFNKYPGRFRMLHIKDFKPVAKPTTELMGSGRPVGVDLGKGYIDYKPIFAAARGAGIEHVFAEQEAPFTQSQMESAKLDYAFLQKFA